MVERGFVGTVIAQAWPTCGGWNMTHHLTMTKSFSGLERAWFDAFDPNVYENDGNHWFNGLPRGLAELTPPPTPSTFTWGRMAAYGLAASALGVLTVIGILS